MADPAAAAPDPGTKSAQDEPDVLRAAVLFLGILMVGLTAVFFVLTSRRDAYREAVRAGEKSLKKMASTYDDVNGLLREFKNSEAEDASKNLQTWLKQRYGMARIQDGQVTTEKWSESPSRDYVEHYVNVTVKGVPRESAVQFLWNVERASTKMKTIEAKLTRTPPPGGSPEADLWELKARFGYRAPRSAPKESGS